MSYDSKCWDLAAHFLAAVTFATAQERKDATSALAQTLQDVSEEYVEDIVDSE